MTKRTRATQGRGDRGRAGKAGCSFEAARELALALPGVEEGTSYGTPAYRVRKKLFARLHDEREALVVRVDMDEKEMLMKAEPETFFITDHYRGHPWVLVRLSSVEPDDLRGVIERAWARCAPKRLREAHFGQ